eukprot:scpid41361/ scgid13101/ 
MKEGEDSSRQSRLFTRLHLKLCVVLFAALALCWLLAHVSFPLRRSPPPGSSPVANYLPIKEASKPPPGSSSPARSSSILPVKEVSKPLAGSSTAPSATAVRKTGDAATLYFVKACKRFQSRALQLYHAWGDKVSHVIFSTDQLLDGIPDALQRIDPLNSAADKGFVKEARQGFQAASCAVTLINLGKVLKEAAFADIDWLMFVDDDTFVIRDNVPKYLGTFQPSKPHLLGLSNAEPLPWNPKMTVAATAPGLVYSRGLLELIRADGEKVLGRSTIYQRCRAAHFGDDVAISLLAREQYHVDLVARPDLRGFHWHKEKTPTGKMPLTIHTEQQFHSEYISEMQQLAAKYYPDAETVKKART